eukprot:4870936-Lingulodinium_polyedra.AAC.1
MCSRELEADSYVVTGKCWPLKSDHNGVHSSVKFPEKIGEVEVNCYSMVGWEPSDEEECKQYQGN